MKKISRELFSEIEHAPFPQKGVLCDRFNVNACQKRAMWYGTDRIGPRKYYVYRCPEHGFIRAKATEVNHTIGMFKISRDPDIKSN